MRRLPGLALPLLALCCAPAMAPAPAVSPAPTPEPALGPTLDAASARRQSADLIALTRTGTPRAQIPAMLALGRVGDTPAIARLIELLRDPALRLHAASALGIAAALGSERDGAEAAVLAVWPAADSAEQASIAPALGRLGTLASTVVLAHALADPDPRLARAAALALGVLGRRGLAWDPLAQPAVIALAARPGDPTLTLAAAYALAHAPLAQPREPLDQALLRLVAAPEPETRALALVGLSRRKAPAEPTRPLFQAALLDPDPWVQVAAVRGLLALADEPAAAATFTWARAQLPLLADPTRAAQAHPVLEALERLAALRDPAGPRPRWRQALPAAQAEAEALLARAPPPARPLLARAACRLAAAAAHDPGWRPPLRCADPGLRAEREILEASVLAAGFGGAARLPRLQQLFAAADPRVRAAAITAAGAFWPEPAIETLWRAGLADPSSAVVGATADAIAALPTAATLSPPLLAELLDRTRRETLASVELYTGLTAALAAQGRPEGLPVCRAGLRLPNAAARQAARACVTRLAADPGPQTPSAPPPLPPHDPEFVRDHQVRWRLTTERGVLDIELDPQVAPWHVATLMVLTRAGFYDGLEFHRVVPGFVVQGGDPEGTGWGGPGFNLPAEPSERPFTRGAVGIADAGKDTGGSQFFLMHARAPHLEGRYTWVGALRAGFEVMDALQVGERIIRADITLHPAAIGYPAARP